LRQLNFFLCLVIIHAIKGRVPEDVVTYYCWWKSEIFLSGTPDVELIVTIASMKNTFNVKYLENGE